MAKVTKPKATPALPIRPMLPDEDKQVRELYRLCHPKWPERPPQFYFAYPTLVAVDGDRIAGSTSFSCSFPTTPAIGTASTIMYGHDVCVHPDYRGTGLGMALAEARLAIARDVRAELFLGFTWDENDGMRRIFEKQGMHVHTTIPNLHPGGVPGLLYVGEVK